MEKKSLSPFSRFVCCLLLAMLPIFSLISQETHDLTPVFSSMMDELNNALQLSEVQSNNYQQLEKDLLNYQNVSLRLQTEMMTLQTAYEEVSYSYNQQLTSIQRLNQS